MGVVGPQGRNSNVNDIAWDLGLARSKEELREKLSAPLPPLRNVVKFNFIAPFYSNPILKFGEEDVLIGVETQFRLFMARKEAKQPPLIILDKDGYVNIRQLEYCLRRLDLESLNLLVKETPKAI